ncbi:MAG: T9SS type A sorting domain-containing protein [Chitinophagales bacterium]|nr:T9SS type A sorting domain-containing protein [Chitinophagales bacterium]
MADKDGNLLFYSNGNYIANKWDVPIENSDSLSFGWVSYVWDSSIVTRGQRYPRSNISIPHPHSPNEYIFFNIVLDTFFNKSPSGWANTKLHGTTIDIAGNFGLGYIKGKRNVLIDSILGNDLIMVKHGNGRDWWLIGHLRNTNCFYSFLITDIGYTRLPNQCVINYVNTTTELSYGGMSPDGSKIATISYLEGLSLYDFDRCSGIISNPVDAKLPEIAANGLIGIAVSFSPNSRFVYVNVTDRIYQYDTWAADIAASKDTVAWYDGFYDRIPVLKTLFGNSQLAPDGKIYLSTGNTTRYYHVIDKPDEKGAACNVLQHAVQLKSDVGGVPYYPNYRLGALAGSGCDTLISDIENQEPRAKTIQVFPNPATDFVTIDYGNIVWERYNTVSLKLTNTIGQVVYESVLPRYSGLHKIGMSNLVNGFYHAEVLGDGRMIWVGKFVKE